MMGFRLLKTLGVAWVLLFSYRLLISADQLSLWMLRAVTISLLIGLFAAVMQSVRRRLAAPEKGERLLTQDALKSLFILCLVAGLVLRFVAWDPGNEGPVAWAGGLLVVASVLGLVVLQFIKDRADRRQGPSFFFDPYWKYGLPAILMATIAIQGSVGLEGELLTLLAVIFWGALVGLIVQVVGRWMLRWRLRRARRFPCHG